MISSSDEGDNQVVLCTLVVFLGQVNGQCSLGGIGGDDETYACRDDDGGLMLHADVAVFGDGVSSAGMV